MVRETEEIYSDVEYVLLIKLLIFKITLTVSGKVNVAVIKQHEQNELGVERVYSFHTLCSIIQGSQERNSAGQEPGGGN